ncbi:MAG: hypothetical protein M3N29_04785 [Chloroflexota bacterium]|nr:hypothetical protein [Chloroflexota bacterium]
MISDRHRYVFIELPRTGTTAVAAELVDNYDGREILGKHSTYRDFLRIANDDQKRYFAFASIRNPLDVAVSRYVQLKTNKGQRFTDPLKLKQRDTVVERIENRIYRWVQQNDATFEQFLRRWYVLPYDTWASLDHRRMDAVLRFEHLGDDFAQTLRRIGIEPLRPLPQVNVTPARERDFVSYYAAGAIGRAVWVFGPYMREWGYEFPASWGSPKVPLWARLAYRVARVFRTIYWRFIRVARGARRPKLAPG